MNRTTLFSILIALGVGLGLGFTFSQKGDNQAKETTSGEKEVAYWVAPMDPNYRREGPGKSPMGMDLIPVYVEEEKSGSDVGFTISPNVLANLGVKTSRVEMTGFKNVIRATGSVQYDDEQTTRVHVRAEGWVEQLAVRAVGEKVEKGDLLFTLYSPIIASALSEYGQLATTGSKRLSTLAESRLKALGLDMRSINSAKKSGNWSAPIPFYAPRKGVVTKLGVREGSLSAKNTIAFEITDPKTMWLIADVFESQAHDLKIGQKAEVIGHHLTTTAKVDFIYPELDKKMQTARVRINLLNPLGIIKSGDYYEVNIETETTDQLTVPSSSVIRLGDGNRVIVSHGNGNFEAAEVIIGDSVSNRTVIKGGLSAGEDVVTSGQFMLDSESSFIGAALRMAEGIRPIDKKTGATKIETEVSVMGTINSVNVDKRQVNISHPAIPDIGWPPMTMDMDVANNIDLLTINTPTKVHFGLGKDAEGMYVITEIHIIDSTKGDMK